MVACSAIETTPLTQSLSIKGAMPKFMFEARYNWEGLSGVGREGGVGRRAAAKKHLEEVGGKLESMYFAFGDVDCFLIADLPDNSSAAAFSLAANESGVMVSRTVVLMTPDELDDAVAKKITFRAPGR
jgi:uncharacterized protein with GYD domain